MRCPTGGMPLLSATMKGIVSRVCAAALLLCAGDVGVARADIGQTIGGRFASDKAVKDHVLSLIDKDVHFTLSLGLWMAFLSRGPIGSATTTTEFDDGPQSADQASSRVGTGRGLLRDATISIDYKGNELYFRYLSDQLLQVGEDELSKRVPGSDVKPLIRQIAGEFRPDLSKLLGPQARAYGRVTYGDFRGGISDAQIFISRNGVPYFAGRDSSWRTSYISAEAGVAPGGQLSYFARYISFERPVVLQLPSGRAFAENGGYKIYGGFALQDGAVKVYGVGPRYQTQSCNDTACLQLDASTIPLLGYTTLDLGRIGRVSGLPFVGSAEVRALLPFKVGSLPIAPFVSFRAEWFLLFVSSAKDLTGDELASLEKPNVFAPDYLLWGPLLGISGEL